MYCHDVSERGGQLRGDDTTSLRTRKVAKSPGSGKPSDLPRTDFLGGSCRGAHASHRKGCLALELNHPVVRSPVVARHFDNIGVVVESTLFSERNLWSWARRRCCDFGRPGCDRPVRAATLARVELRRSACLRRLRILCRAHACRRRSQHGYWSSLDDCNRLNPSNCIARSARNGRSSPFATVGCVDRLVLARPSTFGLDDHGDRGCTLHISGSCDEAFVARSNDSLRAIHGVRDCDFHCSDCDARMSSRPSIAELKSGNSEAWAWFFVEFSGQIAGYARRMGVSDADDVTGTVLETVARSVGSFSGSHSQFRSWVFSIAHARIVDDHRRRDRRPETEFTERHDRTEAGADNFLTSGDPELEIAMNQLTEEQRSLLHLRFVLELSTKEIARVTDKSEVATRVALHRCSKRLRELLSGRDLEMAAEL